MPVHGGGQRVSGCGPARPGDRLTRREDFNCCHLPFGCDLLLPVFSQLEQEPGFGKGFPWSLSITLGDFKVAFLFSFLLLLE